MKKVFADFQETDAVATRPSRDWGYVGKQRVCLHFLSSHKEHVFARIAILLSLRIFLTVDTLRFLDLALPVLDYKWMGGVGVYL